MELHPTGTDPTRDALLVCRAARFQHLILLVVLWCIPVAWWWFSAPIIVTAACALLALLLTPLMLGDWLKRGRPDNWVLALHSTKLWINLRSYGATNAPQAETVLSIPYREIQSIRRTIHKYTTQGSDGKTNHTEVFLDFFFRDTDIEQVENILKSERELAIPLNEYWNGLVKVGNRQLKSFPVDTLGENGLRVVYSSSRNGLTPSIKKVLALLGRYVAIEEPLETKLANEQDLTDEEIDARILHLAQMRDTIEAIRMLRRHREMSLLEAKQFIEELR